GLHDIDHSGLTKASVTKAFQPSGSLIGDRASYRARSIAYRTKCTPSLSNSASNSRPSFSIIRVEATFAGRAIEITRPGFIRWKTSRKATEAASVARPCPQYRRASHHPISG